MRTYMHVHTHMHAHASMGMCEAVQLTCPRLQMRDRTRVRVTELSNISVCSAGHCENGLRNARRATYSVSYNCVTTCQPAKSNHQPQYFQLHVYLQHACKHDNGGSIWNSARHRDWGQGTRSSSESHLQQSSGKGLRLHTLK
jgi:hypothetical protein